MKFQQVKEISDCITQQYISNLNFLQGNVDTLSYFSEIPTAILVGSNLMIHR